MKNIMDIIKVDRCVVRDEKTGANLAILHERYGVVEIERLPACSIGSYFHIMSYLRELGFETK